MKVAEMIEWLRTQDQDATVEVMHHIAPTGWEGDSFTWVKFNPDECSEYVDMRGNRFAIGTPYENDRTLYIGSD